MLGREQKAELPTAAKRIQAPSAKKKTGAAPWAVAAGNGASRPMVGPGRCLAAPTGPSRSPPALQVPRAISRTSAARNDRPGAHTTPDLAAMAAHRRRRPASCTHLSALYLQPTNPSDHRAPWQSPRDMSGGARALERPRARSRWVNGLVSVQIAFLSEPRSRGRVR